MLPLSLFRSRVFSVCSVVGLLINTAFYGLIFVISLFFQRVQGLSPLTTGLALAPVMIGITASNLVSGRMQERLGAARVLALGAAVLAAACAGMLSVGAGTSYGAIVVPLTALGVGGGLVVPTVTAQLLGSVDRSRSGVASGTLNTLRQTGSAVGVALFGSLLAGSDGFVPGVHASFAIASGLGLAIVALAPLLRRGRRVPSMRQSAADRPRQRRDIPERAMFTHRLDDDRWLRMPEESDAEELYELTAATARCSPNGCRGRPAPRSRPPASSSARRRLEFARNGGFSAVIVERDRIVGSIGFPEVNRDQRSCEIGYWLGRSAQGRGTVTLAVRALIDHAFGAWKLHRVVIQAGVGNARSRAVAERLGFTLEGVLRRGGAVPRRPLRRPRGVRAAGVRVAGRRSTALGARGLSRVAPAPNPPASAVALDRHEQPVADRDAHGRQARVVGEQAVDVGQLGGVGDRVVDHQRAARGEGPADVGPVADVLGALGIEEDQIPGVVGILDQRLRGGDGAAGRQAVEARRARCCRRPGRSGGGRCPTTRRGRR